MWVWERKLQQSYHKWMFGYHFSFMNDGHGALTKTQFIFSTCFFNLRSSFFPRFLLLFGCQVTITDQNILVGNSVALKWEGEKKKKKQTNLTIQEATRYIKNPHPSFLYIKDENNNVFGLSRCVL